MYYDGPGCVSYDTAKHWSRRFAEGNFELNDAPHPGRSVQMDVDALEAAVEEDAWLTICCLVEGFGCHHSIVARRLHALGMSLKYGEWIPHEVSAHQLN